MPLPPEGVVKGVHAAVGCAVRTIPNNELRFLNGAHGAPYMVITTSSSTILRYDTTFTKTI